MSRRAEAPFVPISRERYLQHRIAKAREKLKEAEARFTSVPETPGANQREIEGQLAAIKAARVEAEARWAQMGNWPGRVEHERKRYDAREQTQLAEVEALRTSTPRQRFLGAFEERLQAYEAELAALSPTERAADAYSPRDKRQALASGLAKIGVSDGTRIVTLNPNLFDPSKPRGRIQNIVIGTPRYFQKVYGEAQRQIDKAELMKLIE